MNKIYLVTGFSREPYDNMSIILDAFTSKELAEKVANGFDDATDYMLTQEQIKLAERDKKLEALHDNVSNELYVAICDEYEKYEVYYTYYYQVQEIDLIN